VRLLRTVYRLAAAGLLILVKSEGGRLERVQLTKAGQDAVAELRKAGTPAGT
jgi:DNA-binding MarR family transcriptional regulator